ncbi:MAG: TlpA disulfide reductase family protein [Acidimicrobiales bacterium]
MVPSSPELRVGLPGRRRRRGWLALGAVFLGLATLAILTRPGPTRDPATVDGGGAAKPFELPDVRQDAPVVSLESLRGKPVVVNFWASWCVPCRKEMPSFQAVAQLWDDRVAFIGVNHQDSRRLALELLAETGVRYPSGYDPGGTTAAAYGLLGMPTTLFISAEGKVLERRTGEMSRRDLERTLQRLFTV